MNLSTLRNTPGARRRRSRVGRGCGSGSGKTCGRGNKGQMARKGHKHKHGFEGGQMRLIRRIPKRGFKSHSRRAWVAVNVGDLDRFSDGAEVTVGMIREAGLAGGTGTGVKVLGGGDLSRKLTVKVHAFSASARRKIEAAGGSCEVIAQP